MNGRVLAAQYEDGGVEYVAELDDPQVLGWVKDGTIKHYSVEYDWSSLDKVNGIAPRGIQFMGPALVIKKGSYVCPILNRAFGFGLKLILATQALI